MKLPVASAYRLSAGCTIGVQAGGVNIGTREEDIWIASNRPAALAQWLERLQTGATADDGESALPAAAFGELVEQLTASDLLLEIDGAVNAADGPALVLAFQREARFWAKPIFEQPFWTRLLTGACEPAQVLGWGVEFYHFVDGANTYMPVGVAHTRGAPALRQALSRHYVEEMHHGEIFLDGLRRSGIDADSVLAAPPLPHTAALINQLTEIAYEGGSAYAASFAVMQPGLSTGSADELAHFYQAITAMYPYAGPMFAAFHKHAAMDLLLEHDMPPFYALCGEAGAMSQQARRRASRVMQCVAESFILFFEGILDTYGDAPRFAPRRAFSLEAVL